MSWHSDKQSCVLRAKPSGPPTRSHCDLQSAMERKKLESFLVPLVSFGSFGFSPGTLGLFPVSQTVATESSAATAVWLEATLTLTASIVAIFENTCLLDNAACSSCSWRLACSSACGLLFVSGLEAKQCTFRSDPNTRNSEKRKRRLIMAFLLCRLHLYWWLGHLEKDHVYFEIKNTKCFNQFPGCRVLMIPRCKRWDRVTS